MPYKAKQQQRLYLLFSLICLTKQQQQLLSSPRFGEFEAYFPEGLLLWRNVLFTDTDIVIATMVIIFIVAAIVIYQSFSPLFLVYYM